MSAAPSFMTVVFWGVVTFSILVVIHEAGHFFAARAFGVKVHEFMVGLPGPAIRYRSKRSGTAFGVTAIPLGGYVRIAGMEPGPEDPLLGPALAAITRLGRSNAIALAQGLSVSPEKAQSVLTTLADWGAIAPAEDSDEDYVALMDERLADDPVALLDTARSITYRGLPTWKRILVLLAGVAVNLLMAILVFTFVISAFGYYTESMIVEKTVPDSAARTVGIVPGDRLVALDGEPIEDWLAFTTAIASRQPGERITVTYVRDGRERTVTGVLGTREDGSAFFGVQVAVEHVRPGPVGALRESLDWTGKVFVAVADFFRPSTFERSIEGAMSVVGISVEVAKVVRNGPLDYAWLVAFLSLSLGVMNMLPIPPLDGGKVAIELVEKVIGRQLPRRLAYALNALGMMLLLTLVGYLVYADIMRLAGQSISG